MLEKVKSEFNAVIYGVSGIVGSFCLLYLQGEYFKPAEIVQINYAIFFSSFISSCFFMPLATGLQNNYFDFVNKKNTTNPYVENLFELILVVVFISLCCGMFSDVINNEFLSPSVIIFLIFMSTLFSFFSDYFYVTERYNRCLLLSFFSPFLRVICAALLAGGIFGITDGWFGVSYLLLVFILVGIILRFRNVLVLLISSIWPRRWLILSGGLGIFTSFQDRLIYGMYSDTHVLSALLIIGSFANLVSIAERYVNFRLGRAIGIKVRAQSEEMFHDFLSKISLIICKYFVFGLIFILPVSFMTPVVLAIFGFDFQSIFSPQELVSISFIYLLGALFNFARAPLVLVATANDSGKQILFADLVACLVSVSFLLIALSLDFLGSFVVPLSFLLVCMCRTLLIWYLQMFG